VEQTWGDFYKPVCGDRALLEGNICSHVHFITELARYARVGDKVLEIGSGTGLIGYPLAQAGVKVISIDNDTEIIKQALVNTALFGADIEFREADAFKLPFSDREFRVAFSLGLLEHFSDEDIGKLVAEHQRVSDVVVVGMPLKGCRGRAFGNERWLTMKEWESLLKPMGAAQGFVYLEETMCCFTFYRPGFKMQDRPAPPFPPPEGNRAGAIGGLYDRFSPHY